MTIADLYTLQAVADAMGMSERWLRGQIKEGGIEHTRLGHKIRFTEEQYQALVARHVKSKTPGGSMTTGRGRKS